MRSVPARRVWEHVPPAKFWISDLLRLFHLGVKLQKLDDLLLNLVVVFETHRITFTTGHDYFVVIDIV